MIITPILQKTNNIIDNEYIYNMILYLLEKLKQFQSVNDDNLMEVWKSNILNDLKKQNIEIHTRTTFLQGLLLLKKNKIPKQFYKYSGYFKNNTLCIVYLGIFCIKSSTYDFFPPRNIFICAI